MRQYIVSAKRADTAKIHIATVDTSPEWATRVASALCGQRSYFRGAPPAFKPSRRCERCEAIATRPEPRRVGDLSIDKTGFVILPNAMCDHNCGRRGDDPHPCPYKQDLYDDQTECTCCINCTNGCAEDI
jgi:hypothetical protein